jgi:hypothetical protein
MTNRVQFPQNWRDEEERARFVEQLPPGPGIYEIIVVDKNRSERCGYVGQSQDVQNRFDGRYTESNPKITGSTAKHVQEMIDEGYAQGNEVYVDVTPADEDRSVRIREEQDRIRARKPTGNRPQGRPPQI